MKSKTRRLLLRQHALAARAERQRVGRVERQLDAGVLRAEVVGGEVLLHAHVLVLAEEDELRQVLVERAEAVVAQEPMVGCCSSSWCRPVCIWNSAPWSLSVVYIERTKARSSTHAGDVRQPVGDLRRRACRAS